MFSGRHVIESTDDGTGSFFIDRESSSFKYILQYLRDGKTPPIAEAVEVYEEACFYQVSWKFWENSIRRLEKQTEMRKTVRDRLGEEYKELLGRILTLIEKRRSEYLQKCFDS